MSNRLDRVDTVDTAAGDVEIGYTDAIQRHYSRHVVQRKAISQKKLDFERRRPKWLRECAAEATGGTSTFHPIRRKPLPLEKCRF